VYYLRNEKKEHTAHRDGIIEFVRSSQPEHVKKGYRTPSGLTSLLSNLKNDVSLEKDLIDYLASERKRNTIQRLLDV
jgi:hypothetical protein